MSIKVNSEEQLKTERNDIKLNKSQKIEYAESGLRSNGATNTILLRARGQLNLSGFEFDLHSVYRIHIANAYSIKAVAGKIDRD